MDNTKSKKKRKQLALGSYFQPRPKQNKDDTIHQTIIPSVANDSASHERTIKLKSERCKMSFFTTHGLGSHLNSCQYYKEDMAQNKDSTVCKIVLPNVLLTDASGRLINPRNGRLASTLELNATENATEKNIHVRKDCESDGRIRNRGSSNRTTYSSEHKWKHIAQFETWFDQKKIQESPQQLLPIYMKIDFQLSLKNSFQQRVQDGESQIQSKPFAWQWLTE